MTSPDRPSPRRLGPGPHARLFTVGLREIARVVGSGHSRPRRVQRRHPDHDRSHQSAGTCLNFENGSEATNRHGKGPQTSREQRELTGRAAGRRARTRGSGRRLRRAGNGHEAGGNSEAIRTGLEDTGGGADLDRFDHAEIAEPTKGASDSVLRESERRGKRTDRHLGDDVIAVARRALHHLFENHPRRRTELPAQLRCIGPCGHRTTGWFSRHRRPLTRLARRTGARRCRSTPARATPNGARAST